MKRSFDQAWFRAEVDAIRAARLAEQRALLRWQMARRAAEAQAQKEQLERELSGYERVLGRPR